MSVIALDVGGAYIKGGTLSHDGFLDHTERWPTRAERGPEAILETVLGCAAELTRRCPTATAAGIVVPGLVDEGAGRSVLAANLGWRDIPVRDWLAEHLDLPVAFGHDVRAGGLAEARTGAGRDCADFLFVPVGARITAAAFTRGRPMAGGQGRAGEVGHVVVRPGGDLCPCGSRGCLETVASAAAIAHRYTRATGWYGISARDVQARADRGDPAAAAVWSEAVEALADALALSTTRYDPERVVIGGGLARAGESFLAPLRTALAERLTSRAAPLVVAAHLGDRAGCMGAALMARDLVASEAVMR